MKSGPFKTFEIWTKMSGFWMVQFSNGWDHCFSYSMTFWEPDHSNPIFNKSWFQIFLNCLISNPQCILCIIVSFVTKPPLFPLLVGFFRFIPPSNALGVPEDSDTTRANPDNSCYCMASEGFKCHKSGVLNMGPCKRDDMGPPLALSMPHFYQVRCH